MKSKSLAALTMILGIALSASAFAQGRHDEKPHGMSKPAATEAGKEPQAATGGRHDAGGTTHRAKVSAKDKSAPSKSMDMDKHMTQMQENMKKMQQQMEKLQAATDPTERQALMQEHMQTMQENMKTMRGMGGPMMMGSGQSSGMKMAGKKDSMKDGGMMQHHAMMEKRMDMMQMMMEQMMQHDQMTGSMPAK